MKRSADERQAAEDEEAAKWMGMISVEKEGTGGEAVGQGWPGGEAGREWWATRR